MERYIDADALKDKIDKTTWYHISRSGTLAQGANRDLHTPLFKADDVYKVIDEVPAADVVEVKHGEWIYKHRHRGGFDRLITYDDFGNPHTVTVDNRYECDEPYCSVCGKLGGDFLNYCGNCGAKMDVSKNEITTEGDTFDE